MRKLFKPLIWVLFAGLLLSAGCTGRGRRYEELPMSAAWVKIMHQYNKGRYLDAVDKLEVFLINHAGSALADSAQYMLGECHFQLKEYIIAGSEYQKLVAQYPQSPLAEVGEYKEGLSYYMLSPKYSLDQDYTNKAVDTFQLFIEDYPNSDMVGEATKMIEKCRDKLAHKQFDSGRLYQKMKEYTAARIYYDLVLNNYYDTPYAAKAQYYKANSFERQKQWENAIKEYTVFLDKFRDSELADRALRGLNRSRDNLANKREKKSGPNLILPADPAASDTTSYAPAPPGGGVRG